VIIVLKHKLVDHREVISVFRKALDIVRGIRESKLESTNIIRALECGYVEPGPSGALTRGKIDILPTGRNFYAIDPLSIPTKAAWKIGVETANMIINRYLKKHGRYPESIGHVLWSIDAYKSDGEQISQILYLLGVKPIWDESERIKGVEVIPLDKLGRPRIDCVVRISGIVRDTLPNYIYLIDDAISKVISLDESLNMNYPKKHYIEHVRKLIENGRGKGEAEELAKFRVFCSPPGSYGTGVNYAVEASAWKNDEDLAKTWIQWSSYGYSRRSSGKFSPESLILSLKSVDVVTRNHISDEHDIFGCCCYFAYHGGFYNTVKAISERDNVELVFTDTRDISRLEVRDGKLEIERIVRSKLLNPVWISEMKKHGYRGANEFSRKILHLYGWSATTKLVSDWVFSEISRVYALNEEMKKWFMKNNIYAFEEILRRLLEAAERDLWKAPEDILNKLREIYSEVEGILEEGLSGEYEIQGGTINIVSIDDVESWKKNAEEVLLIWKKLKEGE